MNGMNKAYLLGNLGADAELRHFGTRARLTFRLATTEKYKDKEGVLKEVTHWHRCAMWGERVEKLASYLTKGTPVFVEGRIENSSYEKEGQKMFSTEVVVRDLKLLGSSKRDDTRDRAFATTAPSPMFAPAAQA